MRNNDITGLKFGRWTVIETSYREIEEILNKFPELREEYKRFWKYVG